MLEFIESSHTYLYDAIIIPSVSKIMDPLSNHKYSGIPKHILDKAAERGTAVHKAIEDYCYQYDPILDVETELYFENFLEWERDYPNIQITSNEKMFSNGIYAGTIDILAKEKDELLMIDLKCTAKLNDDLLAVQLALYNMLNDKKYTTYVLHLTKDKYTYRKIEPRYDIAEALLKIYEYSNK